MSDPNKKEIVELTEEEIPVLDFDLVVDIEALTLDDLELLSIMSEGSEREQQKIPGYQLIRFIKRLGGAELGNRPQAELVPILKEIARQINEIQDPEDSRGKN